jgi:hypothetical protein
MSKNTQERPTQKDSVPLAAAAIALKMNRERLLRRVQAGEIAGRQIDGRWFVDASELAARQREAVAV